MPANYTDDSVLGFYIAIGSDDYPESWSPNSPFGFDTGNVVPVYTSSLLDAQNVFSKPINITRRFASGNGATISNLIINKPADDFVLLPTDIIWNNAIKIIEIEPRAWALPDWASAIIKSLNLIQSIVNSETFEHMKRHDATNCALLGITEVRSARLPS